MNEIADVLVLCTEDLWHGTDLPMAAPARDSKARDKRGVL